MGNQKATKCEMRGMKVVFQGINGKKELFVLAAEVLLKLEFGNLHAAPYENFPNTERVPHFLPACNRNAKINTKPNFDLES